MMSTDFDAIVVGSGITGGWAAKELCEKGLKVLVLERGKPLQHIVDYTTEHQPPWSFTDRNLPDRQLYERDYYVQRNARGFDRTTLKFWNNDRENPYVQDPDKPYRWLRAGVVGGKSLLWGRHVYRWSDLDFGANRLDGHGNDWPIRYRDIEDWYGHVERFIGVSGEALGLPQLPDSEFLPAMELNVVEKAFRARVRETYPDRHVTIGRVANLTEAREGRGACHYCGPCNRGCSAGAYFSSQSSTLPAASKTGNLTLRPNSIVENLDFDPSSGAISGVRVIDSQSKARHRFTAKMVFLCASAFGSVQVMLNSRSERFPTGIANDSGTLGRYVMDHYHGQGALGSMPGFEGKYYYGNRPNTFYVPRFRNVSAGGKLDFVRGYGFQGAAFPDEWSTTWDKVPGFGAQYKQSLRKPGGWVVGLFSFGETLPYADNRVVLDSKLDGFGIPQLRFDISYRENEMRMGRDVVAEATAMLKAAGARDIIPLEQPFVAGTSVHEFGGARMGKDRQDSVLNEFNQAHDVPNLFVTDGACMASTSCVNPSLTFMALTARAADYATTTLKARGTLGSTRQVG